MYFTTELQKVLYLLVSLAASVAPAPVAASSLPVSSSPPAAYDLPPPSVYAPPPLEIQPPTSTAQHITYHFAKK